MRQAQHSEPIATADARPGCPRRADHGWVRGLRVGSVLLRMCRVPRDIVPLNRGGDVHHGQNASAMNGTANMTDPARIVPGDRVVVTGASGFIGSAVVRVLRARGAKVVAVVQEGVDCRNLDGIDAERVTADIRDAPAVGLACAGARFVFHLAAMYRFWARDPRIFYDVNVGGTLNVVAGARAAGCERVVFTSSVAVLGLRDTSAGRAGRRDMPRGYRPLVRVVQEIQVRRGTRGAEGLCGRARRLPCAAHDPARRR